MDQRQVGSSMRRRMGAPSSHLAMATGAPDVETQIRGFSLPGSGHIPGIPDQFPGGPPPLATDNAEFASEVSAVTQNEPHPGRAQGKADLSDGARLTISPSMKIPTESPVPPYHMGRVVDSGRGRTFGTFNKGAQEVYDGG